jgi:cytochrome c peroxidase
MGKGRLLLSIGCVVVGLFIAVSLTESAQVTPQQAVPPAAKPQQVVPPLYNPYPPGILPDDLVSEIARVRREVNGIFQEALQEWLALPPPNLTGQPPTLQGTGYQMVQVLGKLMNFDENMSPFRNRACGFCHMPYAGFSGPIPSVNLTMVAYPGSEEFRAGKRTAQRYTYSPRFPVLQLNETQTFVSGTPVFIGGNFWDGRATGFLLQSADAEQSQHPPVDTQEHANPDTACIVLKLSQAPYRPLFEQVWGQGSLAINFPFNSESICATPGGAAVFGGNNTPVQLSPEDRTKANRAYDNWAQSISAYEASTRISAFSSKFDAFLADPVKFPLTADEMAGYNLFRGKAGCNTCHLDGRGSTQTPGTGSGSNPSTTTGTDTSQAADVAPLFTCFGYSNLGLPLNPRDAIFYQNKPDPFGFTPNPDGFGFRDLGFGSFLRGVAAPNPNRDWTQFAPATDGQQQVLTARNVAMTPPQCPTTEAPGPYFQKAFFHNGYAKSLKQLVHFYNTRDVFPFNVTSGNCPQGTTEKVNCWPMPEVPNNIDMTVGNLGLTDREEDLIVTFLQTLTDGFTTPYPDRDKFTGQCMTGGIALTQGNEFLIPTPPLPPCAADICGVAPVPKPPIP